jgi:hypothetical protein
MKKIFILTVSAGLILSFISFKKSLPDYPGTIISNGIIEAKVYFPDPEKGFYRGSRFDWSGVIASLKYKNHQYFGQWFVGDHDPFFHDAIAGPVDEFLPPGFDTVKAGGKFLRIGIGMMIRPDDKPFFFGTRYAIANGGKWETKNVKNGIEFRHYLKDDQYAYVYTKTLSLPDGESKLLIRHELKNTGRTTIETTTYNHNFFVIDDQPTGPSFTIRFPYSLSGAGKGDGEMGKLNGNQIEYLRVLNKGENLSYSDLKGYGNEAKDYNISIENSISKAGVNISGDRPLHKLVYWSAPKTVCPEPFIKIRVEPGKTFSWTYTYIFYEKI